MNFILAVLLAQQMLFLVRHAEKVDNSPDAALSEKGEARAKALAEKLRDAGITAIFVSERKRTQQTAAPLAEALKIKPVVHDARDTAGMVKLLRAQKRALVVGHSDTLPEIAAAYGAKLERNDDEFDALWILVPRTRALVHLHQ